MTQRRARPTIAAYIERFRGPPTSRQERERSRSASKREFWWIAERKSDGASSWAAEDFDDLDTPTHDEVRSSTESAPLNVSCGEGRQRNTNAVCVDCTAEEEVKRSDGSFAHSEADDDLYDHEGSASEPPSPPPSPLIAAQPATTENEDEHQWNLLSPLSSPKNDGMIAPMSPLNRTDDLEAMSVGSSLTDTIDPQWYVRPEEVLVEDPEVTIQRLRQRLGLSSFATEWCEPEWRPDPPSLEFDEWGPSIQDHMRPVCASPLPSTPALDPSLLLESWIDANALDPKASSPEAPEVAAPTLDGDKKCRLRGCHPCFWSMPGSR
ncbi:hypothetical protein ACHHYP_20459 [Achlya hypogyna]|uniref:Uncharacterized protein n=1 Tax=Achlya hypogyna TaxID=1202772 RepID=A0A1V9ZID3_ACHHY|nr:hypothetical protein ACHHYP_20459 [Achlya hypogyna]